MEVEVDDKELKAAGAEPLTDGRYGLRIHGWDIESRNQFSAPPIPNCPLFNSNWEFNRSPSILNFCKVCVVLGIFGDVGCCRWEQKLHTCHMPEMVFGDSGLFLKHVKSGATIHFNSFDALVGWKKEDLPPVEVPAAAQWKFRTKPSQQVILDYDYTFTTPYSGSETL